MHHLCMLLAGPPKHVPDVGALVEPTGGSSRTTCMYTVRRATDEEDRLDVTRALALDALRLGRALRDRSRWPASWGRPAFGAEVERHRRTVARIRTREDLTTAYERDVFLDSGRRRPSAESAIRVAYALRWLELFDDATAPSWPALVG